MAMIKFGDYYINPKHVSCVGINEENMIGTCKYWYEVSAVCYGHKITTTYKTRSDAEELVQQIVMLAS